MHMQMKVWMPLDYMNHQLISVVGSSLVLALCPKQSSLGVRFLLLDKSKCLLPVSYYRGDKYLTMQ